MSQPPALDLFGQPIPAPSTLRKDGKARKIGYAARPGTGPRGQRCNTCIYCIPVEYQGHVSRKCQITAATWTPSSATDIKHNAPACSEWERKPFRKISYDPHR